MSKGACYGIHLVVFILLFKTWRPSSILVLSRQIHVCSIYVIKRWGCPFVISSIINSYHFYSKLLSFGYPYFGRKISALSISFAFVLVWFILVKDILAIQYHSTTCSKVCKRASINENTVEMEPQKIQST